MAEAAYDLACVGGLWRGWRVHLGQQQLRQRAAETLRWGPFEFRWCLDNSLGICCERTPSRPVQDCCVMRPTDSVRVLLSASCTLQCFKSCHLCHIRY